MNERMGNVPKRQKPFFSFSCQCEYVGEEYAAQEFLGKGRTRVLMEICCQHPAAQSTPVTLRGTSVH